MGKDRLSQFPVWSYATRELVQESQTSRVGLTAVQGICPVEVVVRAAEVPERQMPASAEPQQIVVVIQGSY